MTLMHWFCCTPGTAICSTVTDSGNWIDLAVVDCIVCRELALAENGCPTCTTHPET